MDLANGLGTCSRIWGVRARRGREEAPFTSARPPSAGTSLPLYLPAAIMILPPDIMPRPTHSTIIVALIASAGLLAGCGQGQKQAAAPPPKVTVATPVKRTIVDQDEYVGRFVAVDSVEIRSRVSGYLDQVHFQDGQTVKQ